MKIAFSLPKKLAVLAVAFTVFAGFVAVSATAAFGPDRPTRAWSDGLNGFEYVTFNSFTGVPNGIGDERDFMRGVQVGRDGNWIDPVANVSEDAEIQAKIYIHNNAASQYNDAPGNPGVARDVRVKVELPEGVAASHDIRSEISASNAQPQMIFDTLTVSAQNAFQLEYVPGSARLFAEGSETSLSDSLVTTGVTLDDHKGCFEYIREIVFNMKVTIPKYTVEKMVRLDTEATNAYAETKTAKNGDTVVWRVEFTNTGTSTLREVKFTDPIPAGSSFVPGSIRVFNAGSPDGYNVPDTALQLNGTQLEINLGDYAPTGNAFIYFKTTVNVAEADKCEGQTVKNIAFVRPEDQPTIGDSAEVKVPAEVCEEEAPLPPVIPSVGSGNILGLLSVVTVAGAVAHRLYTVRFKAN